MQNGKFTNSIVFETNRLAKYKYDRTDEDTCFAKSIKFFT